MQLTLWPRDESGVMAQDVWGRWWPIEAFDGPNQGWPYKRSAGLGEPFDAS